MLLKLLKPALARAALDSQNGSVRIIFATPALHPHSFVQNLLENWDPSDKAALQWSPQVLHARSVLACVQETEKFADLFQSCGVVVASVHLGCTSTIAGEHSLTLSAEPTSEYFSPLDTRIYFGRVSKGSHKWRLQC